MQQRATTEKRQGQGLLRQGISAVIMLLVLTLLTGVAYPLVITGLSQLFFQDKANGSLIRDADGTVVGSSLIGQPFAAPQYFHPRPSAAKANSEAGYDASASSDSNLGPTNQALIDAVRERAAAYRDRKIRCGGLSRHTRKVARSASSASRG